MAHSDSLIFVNLVFWGFVIFFFTYIIFNVKLFANFFKKIRTRAILGHSLFLVNISLVESFLKIKFFYVILFTRINNKIIYWINRCEDDVYSDYVINAFVRAADVIVVSSLCIMCFIS